jgi:hypothetical protein
MIPAGKDGTSLAAYLNCRLLISGSKVRVLVRPPIK